MKKLKTIKLYLITLFVLAGLTIFVFTAGKEQGTAYADTSNMQTYVTFDEEGVSPGFVTWGDASYSFQIPSSGTGKKFQGWYYNGQQYTDANGRAVKAWDIEKESVTLNAQWQTTSYTLQTTLEGQTYYYAVQAGWTKDGNSRCTSGTVLKSITQIQDDFRSGIQIENMILDYFTLNGNRFTLTENRLPFYQEGTYTLTPMMKEEMHTIYFDANGGILNNASIIVESGSDISGKLSDVECTRENYFFDHWEITESSGNTSLINTKLETRMPDCTTYQGNGSIKVKAIWTEAKYSILYNLNGGENSADNPYSYEPSNIIKLNDPTKAHYVFAGWYLDSGFMKKITEIKNSTGDLVLYAKWTAIIYTISIKKDNVIFEYESGSYGTVFYLPIYEKTGYRASFCEYRHIQMKRMSFQVWYKGGDKFTIIEDNTLTVEWDSTDIINSYTIRTEEKTITDNGRMTNHYDYISLITLSRYNITNLKNQGYKTIKITVSLDAREIDDGYQYIFLYNGLETSNTAVLIQEIKFEHGSGYKDKNFKNYTFTFDKIYLSSLPSSFIYIRYGASGAGADDWVNKNIKVKAIISEL